MQRLSGLDAGFLYMETRTLHMHTLKVAVVDPSTVPGGYTFERFKEVLEERLHLLPPFRRRLVMVPLGLHHPLWIEDAGFDLDDHVGRIGVPPPGTRREMDEMISLIASTQLDRDRPLWQIWVLEGLEGGQVGFVAKIHHCAADGVAACALLANLMSIDPDLGPPAPPSQPWLPEEPPAPLQLATDALQEHAQSLGGLPGLLRRTTKGVRHALRSRRELGSVPPQPTVDLPRTSFNRSLTPHRVFATTSLPLDEAKRVKDAFGVTLNDVVLGLVAGSLRAYLDARFERLSKPLVAGIPVSTDKPEEMGRLGGNRVGNVFTSLRTDLDDPVARLHAISEVTKQANVVGNSLGVEMLADWVEFTPPGPLAWFTRASSRFGSADHHRPPVNLVVSHVPGPREPRYVAGARLAELYSVGPVLEGIGLNITVRSYVDRLHVSALACKESVPQPHRITDGLHHALAELGALADARGAA